MKGWTFATKMLLTAVFLHWALVSPAAAQQKPVMENVFFNVVWGSAVGAILGVSTSVIGSDDHSAPSEARSSAFTGATIGGLAGLGVGLYLVFQGITFEPVGSTFISDGSLRPADGSGRSQDIVAMLDPPFVLVTSGHSRTGIDGFRARVFELKF